MASISSFNDRVVVVTGGASGIGKGLARAFKAEGAVVVIADVERRVLEAAAEEVGATAVACDVSDYGQVEALANETLRRFGRVDIVCNNAGVSPKVKTAEATLDDWRWILGVNLWGVIHGIKAFLPHLVANPNGGQIVNTASSGGFLHGPLQGPYSATKAAVVAMSETLSRELALEGANVGVTIFCPGTVRTNLHMSMRNRPAALGDAKAVDIDLMKDPVVGQQRWLTGDQVAAVVLDAIRQGSLYVTSHPEIADMVDRRITAILAEFRKPTAVSGLPGINALVE